MFAVYPGPLLFKVHFFLKSKTTVVCRSDRQIEEWPLRVFTLSSRIYLLNMEAVAPPYSFVILLVLYAELSFVFRVPLRPLMNISGKSRVCLTKYMQV